MIRLLTRAVVCGFVLLCGTGLRAASTADFYMVDVGTGNAIFLVTPSGETMLMDTGSPNNEERLVSVMQRAGLKQIDYLVISHFDGDHYGSAAALSEKVPVLTFVDHGDTIELGRSEAWWKEYGRPWYRPGITISNREKPWIPYRQARDKAKHLIVQPGDRVPIKGADALVVSAGGVVLMHALEGAGKPNPACAGLDYREDVYTEDGQSVGLLISFGKFRFIYLGDLIWNRAMAMFCPNNLVGTVDAYVVTHHSQNFARQAGEHFYGLSSCPPSEIHGLRPTVAMLSVGVSGPAGGLAGLGRTVPDGRIEIQTPACMQALKRSPGLKDLGRRRRSCWESARTTTPLTTTSPTLAGVSRGTAELRVRGPSSTSSFPPTATAPLP